ANGRFGALRISDGGFVEIASASIESAPFTFCARLATNGTWSSTSDARLKRAIYTGRISPAQAKRVDEMQAVADALSLMANIVMAWNTSQMQAVLDRWSNRRQVIPPELIGKIAPTRLESINLRGVFRFPVDRYADQILPSRPNASITGTNG
uniref:Tn3 family transposase n=1 Tax=Elstera cyanobacteriorum TaxID=2022747 RepID=UPI0023F1F544